MPISLERDKNYRLGVGIILINKYMKVFVGQRFDSFVEAWQMPQGGIEPNESPQDAAMRELEEEVGTNHIEVIAESKDWYYYDLPPHLQSFLWSGRYLGQKQKWFLFKFLGHDSAINIKTSHPEFVNWQWIELSELPKIIVPFKQQLYKDLIIEFGPIVNSYKQRLPILKNVSRETF